MATSYSTLTDLFFRRIEKDRDFFDYFNLSETECMALAKDRASAYLEEAIYRLMTDGLPSVDFTDRTDEQFNFDLTPQEKLLIPSLMYEYYMQRDMAYLKTLTANYTSTAMRVFDPSSARSTYMTMYDTICEQNNKLLETYRSSDRSTGSYKSIDFSLYDIEEDG